MSKKNKILIAILFAGIGMGVYDFYTFQADELPILQGQVSAKKSAVSKAEQELARLKTFAANIENVKQELNELNLQLEAALEHMPRNFNLSDLLRKLSLLAQNSGIEVFTFKPRKIQENDKNAAATFYSTIGIDFDLKGTYTQTLLFLDQLSRMKRIVSVESIRVKPQSNATGRGNGLLAETQAKIKTYRFSE